MDKETARIIMNFLEQLGVEVNNKVSALVEVSWPVIVRQEVIKWI